MKRLESEQVHQPGSVAHQVLQHSVTRYDGVTSADQLRIASSGSQVSLPGGGQLDLSKRPSLRGIVLALGREWQSHPGRSVPAAEVFSAGWPNEKASDSSVSHRVQVAISTLRGLGLREFILTGEDGYFIDSDIAVVVEL
jgi:hypothetical protein